MITIEASRPFRTTLTTFLDDAVAAGHMRVEEVGERKEYYPTSDLRRMFAYVTPGMVTITRESAMGDVSIELDQRKTLAWVSMRRTTYGTKETFKEIYDQSAMIETEKMLVGYRRRHNIPTGR